MKGITRIFYPLTIAALMAIGCKKPYSPPIVSVGKSYLVVEGAINTGQDSTIIHLSHTIPLSAPAGAVSPPELGAAVVVQSDANTSIQLTDAGNGYYISPNLNLSGANKYRLQITTADAKVYQSDFVQVKNSPPIDSVSYQVLNNAVQINVNTHDASNSSRYYRWDYYETWIIHAKYQSQFILQTQPKDTIVYRDPSQQIFKCWNSGQSSDIVLASTAKLSQDILINSPITSITSTSEKLTERYSILVKQYALTKEAFDYYQLLRKNTEQLGGIFSPQPSSLTGNVHCLTVPSETVIGYISAGSVTKQRIYINSYGLPPGPLWIPKMPYDQCTLDTFLYAFYPRGSRVPINQVAAYLYTGYAIPVNVIAQPGQPPVGYTGSIGACVDCTLRGTNRKPDFWIDR